MFPSYYELVMKKILFLLSFLIVPAMNAMEEKQVRSKLQLAGSSITNALIFHNLYWSDRYQWSNYLGAFIRKSEYFTERKPKCFTEDGVLRFRTRPSDNPDDNVKWQIMNSTKKPIPSQSCSVFIDKFHSKLADFSEFFSKIYFDEQGDLDHIETEIILEGSDQVKKFENMYGFDSDIVFDEQTEGKKVKNEEDHVTWSFITKKMSHETFLDKFRQVYEARKKEK